MKIDALTVCVGRKYSDYLLASCHVWADTLDSLTIVTDFSTGINFVRPSHVRVFRTSLFTNYGASFNKGAALSAAFGKKNPQDWVLNFDADIIPPKDWRKRVEPLLEIGKLHGCSHRYREDGSLIPDADFPNIWGFFHLWHVLDHHAWRRPVYDVTCGHAGNYDHTFMMHWPENKRTELPIKLIHQGEPRESWFGADHPKNKHWMANLFTLGLYEAWLTRAGHIRTPPFETELILKRSDPDTPAYLSRYTDPDPFRYKVEVI